MYELLCREFGSDTGVFFATLTEAIGELHPGDEIWQVADDVPRTRMVKVWPEPEGATPTIVASSVHDAVITAGDGRAFAAMQEPEDSKR